MPSLTTTDINKTSLVLTTAYQGGFIIIFTNIFYLQYGQLDVDDLILNASSKSNILYTVIDY